jgi:DNA-binding CsgD family transcriptional regulator
VTAPAVATDPGATDPGATGAGATADPASTGSGDAVRAERAWADGDAMGAIDAADRALASGSDPGARAAGVAAAVAAADGALVDAADRWRGIAVVLDADTDAPSAAAVWATARAALVSALAGDATAGAADLADARDRLPSPAPRGLAVLVDGAAAALDALCGAVEPAARRLAGLAAATVPTDPFAPEQWGELAATVAAAGGHERAARAMLDPVPGSRPTTRQRLLAAWLDLRAGALPAARATLADVGGGSPVLRRNAVLAAAVGVGLARRSGDAAALTATWHRVAPVMAGADVELFLIDAWGELSVGAVLVGDDSADLPGAIAEAVTGAGSPWWAVASAQWWRLERAVVAEDAGEVGAAAARLAALAVDHPVLRVPADAAARWVAVLTGDVDAAAVDDVATALDAVGRPWEAAQLCRAATARAGDPAVSRALLETGRRLRPARASRRATGPDELSDREREVGALVVDGLTHKEIGARLYISPKTVEQHVARLRQKLAAATRADLVAALRSRLA